MFLLLIGIYSFGLIAIVELTRIAVLSVFNDKKGWDAEARQVSKIVIAVTFSCIITAICTTLVVKVAGAEESNASAVALVFSIPLALFLELIIAIFIRRSPWTEMLPWRNVSDSD